MDKKIKLRNLLIVIVVECLLIMAVVWFFDPFFQYHAPFPGQTAVLNDRDNQMPGSIRNFTYNSVLMGSSVAENFDSEYLDEKYNCNTLKVIRASGSVADLLYYLEMAQKEQELQNIFWCLDLFAISSSPQCTLKGGNTPLYLHTESVLDDYTYIFNKEILFKTIPANLAYGLEGRNVGGDAYNWAADKEFGAPKAMQAYHKPETVLKPEDYRFEKEDIQANLEMISEQIRSHPESRYYFIFPPYSMLWWDCAYVNGQLDDYFYILESVIPLLLSHENVEVYFYSGEETIITNLNYYMDQVHYSPDINQVMLEKMYAGDGVVTSDNWKDVIFEMKQLVQKVTEELIYNYYPKP